MSELPATSTVHHCDDEAATTAGVTAAVDAIRDGGLIVMPTDTVYGIGCDAFDAGAVSALLAAKGRGRHVPPPVLVPGRATVDGLATEVPGYARELIEEFWPGPLTLVLRAQASLVWDIGETNGTVALRMPDHPVALAVLRAVGPMAVTSANRTGAPAATTVDDAQAQLGDAVSVYLGTTDGPVGEALPSTIVDCTGMRPTILRQGALPQAEIDRVVEATTAAADAAAAAERRAYDEALAAAERARRREAAVQARAADPRRNGPRVAGARRRP